MDVGNPLGNGGQDERQCCSGPAKIAAVVYDDGVAVDDLLPIFAQKTSQNAEPASAGSFKSNAENAGPVDTFEIDDVTLRLSETFEVMD